MFDGNYGSAEENCLEQKLDQLELQQGIIQVEEAARQLYIYILELQTKVKRRFAKISQSQRWPLLGPSPGCKRLLVLSHLKHYAKWTLTPW